MVKEQAFPHIYLTDHCNLECKHCFLCASPNKKTFISWEKIKNVLNYFNKIGSTTIHFSGGEAITSPYLLKAIDYSKKIGYKKITIATNGISPTIFKLPIIPEIELYFSLDGFNPETHDLVRGPNTFKTTIKHLKKAIVLGYKTFVNFTVNKQNQHEVIPLIHYLNKIKVDTIGFNFLSLKGRAKENKNLGITPETWRKTYYQIINVKRVSHSTIRIPPTFLTKEEINKLNPALLKCLLYSPTRTEVTPQGQLFHCCLLVDQAKYSGGQITDDKVTVDHTNELLLLKNVGEDCFCPARSLEFPKYKPSANDLIPICFYYRTVITPNKTA